MIDIPVFPKPVTMKKTSIEVVTLETVLDYYEGNVRKASAFFRISNPTLYSMLRDGRTCVAIYKPNGTYRVLK